MATSGTTIVEIDSVESLQLYWIRDSYSLEDNTSTVSWEFSYVCKDNTNMNHEIDVRYEGFFGTSEDISGTRYSLIQHKVGKQVIASGTVTIPHHTNGTQTFTYTLGAKFYAFGGLEILSGVDVLDAIPTPATITKATDFTDEGNPTIYYSNVSGDLVTRVEACISFTGAIDDVPYREISKTNDWYTFELTDSERATLRKGITSGSSKTVRFYVKTTIDTKTYWSYLTKTLTLVNYKPTITPTVIDINPTTAALTGNTGKLVRYYSNAAVLFGAIARKEATITKKTATNGSQSFDIEDASQDNVTINKVEDNVFNLSVTDSRGNSVSKQVHFKGDNFIPYFNVTCAQTVRLNLDKTATLIVEGNYYNGSFGAVNNTLTVQVRHRENGGSWGAWGDVSSLISDISNNTYLVNATVSGYDPSGTYDFQCRAIDKLTTAESAIETITLEPIFDWGRDDFNFNVPLTIEGNALNDFVIETGTEAMGTNGTWHWSKWKSGRAECYGCRNYGNMAVNTAWGSLYRSDTFVQSLPSGLFASPPEVIDISLRNTGNYGGWIIRHEAQTPDEDNTGSFAVVRPASTNLSQAHISFNIIGRWK